MATAVPQSLLGKNVAWTVTPLTINGSTGVVTTGTAVSFFGVLQESMEANSVEKASFSPTDNPNRNKVIIEQGGALTWTEFMQAAAPSGVVDANTGIAKNALEALARTSYHYLAVGLLKDNSGATVRTVTYYLQFISLDETYPKAPGIAKMNVETFSLMSAGAYITNPAYS